MAQYRNVLEWLDHKYLTPAVDITRKVVKEADATAPEPNNYKELKEIETLLETALEYVKLHQK